MTDTPLDLVYGKSYSKYYDIPKPFKFDLLHKKYKTSGGFDVYCYGVVDRIKPDGEQFKIIHGYYIDRIGNKYLKSWREDNGYPLATDANKVEFFKLVEVGDIIPSISVAFWVIIFKDLKTDEYFFSSSTYLSEELAKKDGEAWILVWKCNNINREIERISRITISKD